MAITPKQALEFNIDALQRELDQRNADGEDVSHLRITKDGRLVSNRRAPRKVRGPIQDDTPSLANCDDWGTGEGRFHGRM